MQTYNGVSVPDATELTQALKDAIDAAIRTLAIPAINNILAQHAGDAPGSVNALNRRRPSVP